MTVIQTLNINIYGYSIKERKKLGVFPPPPKMINANTLAQPILFSSCPSRSDYQAPYLPHLPAPVLSLLAARQSPYWALHLLTAELYESSHERVRFSALFALA